MKTFFLVFMLLSNYIYAQKVDIKYKAHKEGALYTLGDFNINVDNSVSGFNVNNRQHISFDKKALVFSNQFYNLYCYCIGGPDIKSKADIISSENQLEGEQWIENCIAFKKNKADNSLYVGSLHTWFNDHRLMTDSMSRCTIGVKLDSIVKK